MGAILAVGLTIVTAASFGAPRALAPRETPQATVIENVRVLAMTPGAGELQEHMSVLVMDGRIVAAAPSDQLARPAGAQVIDGGGGVLMPGLIDAHVHVWDEAELCAFLAHGVTSVRNMSGFTFHLRLSQRILDGELLGPDLVTTGPILNSPGPNEQIIHQLVRTEEDARAAVRAQHAAGFRSIKAYSNLTVEAYAGVRDEAERLGMSITGHTPDVARLSGAPHDAPFAIAFEDVLDDGFATIEHTESIVWHGLGDRLDEDAMRALAGRIAAAGVYVTPTLIAHDNLVRVAESRGAYLQRPGVETLNPVLRAAEVDTYRFWSDPARLAREAPRAAFYLTATRLMHEAGVPLVAGSDAGIFTNLPGGALLRELELLVEAGLSPHEALAAATATAGPAIGLTDRGQIAPGFRANLVLLAGDPRADLGVLAHPRAVMVGGAWLDAAALERMRAGARNTNAIRSARRVGAMLSSLR